MNTSYETPHQTPARQLGTIRCILAGCILIVAGCAADDDASTATPVVPVPAPVTNPPPGAFSTSTSSSAPTLTTTTTPAPTTTRAEPESPTAQLDEDLANLLQQIVTDAVSTLPNPEATIQATVLRGSTTESWSGTSSQSNGAVPFRMASVGKTFTAATILRLIEDGAFTLDDPIEHLVTTETATLLDGDRYRLDEITVNQLLHHTAGFYDYGFGDGSPFLERVLTDFHHQWTRAEQLQLAVDFGDPLAAPGAAFRYDDTGYVLLGEIIEQATGKPYAIAMRETLDYERLGLDQLWLESGEPAPAKTLPIARTFIGTTEITELDFSADAFGGGGLAATGLDIARFYDAIFRGEVFHHPATIALMLQIPDTNLALEEFGIPLGEGASGLYRLDVAGKTCWNHRGFLGTIAITCPEADITVVVTTNTSNTEPLPIATALIAVMTN